MKNYFKTFITGSFLFLFSLQACMHEPLETEVTNIQQDPVFYIRNEYMRGKDMVAGKPIEWDKARKYKNEHDIIFITVPVRSQGNNLIEELSFRIDNNKVSGHLWKFKTDIAFSSDDYKLTAHEIMNNMTGTVSYIALEGSMRYEKKIVRGQFIDEVARNGSGPITSPSCRGCHEKFGTGQNPIEIGPIDVPPPKPTDPFPTPIPGGVGGGTNPQNPDNSNNNDPCKKGKNLQNKPEIKKNINNLKDHAKNGKGEKGFKAKSDGSSSGVINGGNHSVDMGDKLGYQGGFHNHTSTGISMHSPTDIDMLLGFARAQGNQGNNAQNAFFGMVGPDGTQYITWFNGSYQDAISDFTKEQITKFTNDYVDLEKALSNNSQYSNDNGATLNSKGLEKLFSDTIKKMGLDGKISLQRVDPDNSIKNINFNPNGESTPVPCP